MAVARVLLIVDDEPDILLTLRAFAARAMPEVEIDIADSGQAALAAMRRRAPSAILCDYRMPDLDGLQVLLESVRLAPDARRALMTAFADSSLPERARAAVPLDAFLEKAMSPKLLRERIQALMQPRQAAVA